MQFKIKGILSYPHLFQPRAVNPGDDPKYSASVLLRKDDPQLATVQNIVAQEKAREWPTGFPAKGKCFLKDGAAEYPNDPKMAAYMIVSGSAYADSRPAVVDSDLQPVTDPSQVFAGAVVWAVFNSFTYKQAVNSGVSAGLNGVMVTGETGELGRLDGRPSVDAMFGDVTAAQFAAPAAHMAAVNPSPIPAPTPVPTPIAPRPEILNVPAPAPAVVARTMTAKAAGAPYEAFVAQGWTDDMLRQQGYML